MKFLNIYSQFCVILECSVFRNKQRNNLLLNHTEPIIELLKEVTKLGRGEEEEAAGYKKCQDTATKLETFAFSIKLLNLDSV